MTPDLAELKRIAEAATQSEWSAEQLEHPRYNAAPPSWEFWVNIPTGTDLFLDAGPSPDEPNAQFTANTPHGYSDHDGQAWRDVQFIATAKPKVVLALIARIEALEGERDDMQSRYILRMADIREASGVGHKPMLDEVAEAIRGRIEALEAGLTPFAKAAGDTRWADIPDSAEPRWMEGVTMGDFRRAANLLGDCQQEGAEHAQ